MPHFFEYEEKECGVLAMEIEQAFGIVLRKLRTERSLSQEELAHMCNLDRTFISLMERGKRKPTISTIFALAIGLNQKASDLIMATERILESDCP